MVVGLGGGSVIDAAKAVAIPMDREVIHVIPQEFIIDDQDSDLGTHHCSAFLLAVNHSFGESFRYEIVRNSGQCFRMSQQCNL